MNKSDTVWHLGNIHLVYQLSAHYFNFLYYFAAFKLNSRTKTSRVVAYSLPSTQEIPLSVPSQNKTTVEMQQRQNLGFV